MDAIRVDGIVDANHQLSASVPGSVPPGPVVIWIASTSNDDDSTGQAWFEGISREWAEDLRDPCQDIYTLEDGEPVDTT